MLVRTALALALLAVSAGAAEISIERGTLGNDKSASLAVSMTAKNEAPTGIQFDLEYDGSALDLSVEAGPASKQASKGVQFRVLQPGKLRVLIIGFNRNPIADGVLALIHVTYKGNEPGKSFSIHVTGQSGTDADAKPVAVTAKDGVVTVSK